MAIFKKEKKKNPSDVPPIAPKLQPMTPSINQTAPIAPDIPNPFGHEDTKPITKEINPNAPQKDEPFFVRIDKFNQAKDNFEDISRKLNSLDRLMEKMDELKVKENKEIEEFKKDTESIKQTLTQVDKEIFSKL
jgi:hypothetical protein